MSPILDQFFSLLRAGLWIDHTPDIHLFDKEVDWKAIYTLAAEQTVTAIVWDGVEKLPLELRPSKALSLKWYSYVVKTQQTNLLINKKIAYIFSRYKEEGLHPILLKGGGVAAFYNNPMRRGCGDIDIYVGKGADYTKANSIAENEFKGINIHKTGQKVHRHDYHTTFTLPDGLTVENHTKFTSHFSPSISKRFDAQLAQWYPRGSESVNIEQTEINIAPIQFNAQYVFIHMYRHLFTQGVGLRQICDCAVLFNRLDGGNIELVGYNKGWAAVASFLVEYIGVPSEKIPNFKGVNSKKNKTILSLILDGGNFGTHLMHRRPNGYWSGKFFSFRRQISRWPIQMHISFGDTMRFIFYCRTKDIWIYIEEWIEDKLKLNK